VRLAVWIALAACGDNLPAPDPLAPVTLVDTNPDPTIVEVSVVATTTRIAYLPETTAEAWAYRDGSVAGSQASVPGPLLEAHQGDHVIVHFRNELAEPTTIHWHGIRVPNASDGSEHTQQPVAPGDTFDYEFTAVDAGTFWYHPHARGDVQVEKGLYAPLIVHGGVEPAVDADRMFVLDDVKLAEDGELDDTIDDNDLKFGRQGNTLLVNGKVSPKLSARAGARERWRFVDAANSRFFNLSLPGHPFLVIGWDGGLIPEPYTTDSLLLGPGERYEVIVELDGEPNDSLVLQTLYYDRAPELHDPGPLDLMTIELGSPATALDPLPTEWAAFDPLPTDATSMQNLTLHEDPGPDGKTAFSINGQVYPDVTPIAAAKDALAVWTINDDVGMDHPFHLHGMFFQVIDIDGVPAEHRGWKDTAIVPRYKKLRFAVRYGEPGHWMFHCHILEHQERGMMGVLDVTTR